jgi:chromosome transmission fidelity protein 18
VVTEELVRLATVGVKESETSVQSVWSDLFVPLNKKRVKTLGLSPEGEARWVSRLAHSVESSGNVDKVALGERVICITRGVEG